MPWPSWVTTPPILVTALFRAPILHTLWTPFLGTTLHNARCSVLPLPRPLTSTAVRGLQYRLDSSTSYVQAFGTCVSPPPPPGVWGLASNFVVPLLPLSENPQITKCTVCMTYCQAPVTNSATISKSEVVKRFTRREQSVVLIWPTSVCEYGCKEEVPWPCPELRAVTLTPGPVIRLLPCIREVRGSNRRQLLSWLKSSWFSSACQGKPRDSTSTMPRSLPS
jgi:hypothetical protein